jgi:hypothetical protein
MADQNMNYGNRRANLGWWVVAAVAIVGIILAFWGGAARRQHSAAGRRPSIDYGRPSDRGTMDRGTNAPSPSAPDEGNRATPPPSDEPPSSPNSPPTPEQQPSNQP